MSTLNQRSFAAGEIAPSLYARVDTVKYATGAKTVRNFFVMRHGGLANRPGTEFIGEVKDSSKTVRLIPFIFNSSQTYVLEFGNLYMRVIRDGAYQSDLTLTITGISNANPGVVTYTGSDPTAGEEVYISGITGAIGTYLNGRNFKVGTVNGGANTFELKYMDGTNVNTTAMGAYTSGGTAERVYTLTTSYVEADLSTLQFVQSADVVTIVHHNYAPAELARTGHTSWTLTNISFTPSILAPANLAVSGVNGTTSDRWVVTSVDGETGEESLPTTYVGSNATATVGAPRTLTWDAVTGAGSYNVYKIDNGGVYGFYASAASNTFLDQGQSTSDPTDTPPTARNPFSGANDYPAAVTYFQQRRGFANTNNEPEKCWFTRSGLFSNLTTSSPSQDDDAVTFKLSGRQVNEVRHLIDVGSLISLTSGGEWSVAGDSAGILKPGEINAKQYSYNGSSTVRPLVVGGNALYIQGRGSVVRDLAFDYQSDGYRGQDLTIFSAHLVDGYTITDWDFQQIPHSVVWMVRDDGTLLGMTYVREQQMIGWHKHDFDGTVENVCVVPENNEDYLYLTIKRTINGATKRYVERMASRRSETVEDYIFMDAALSYDGRNTNASHTMTLSGGTDWTYTETLTLTSSAAFFTSADVGNAIHLTGSDGTLIRFTINAYSSSTVVTGKAHKTVPVAMRSVAISDWTKAVDELSGLWHLEGKTVSVYADGFVVASPNNEAYTTVTVTNGAVTLDQPYGVIYVGLPITADLETLDIDMPNGETLANKSKNVQSVTLHVEASRGIWVGAAAPTDDDVDPLEGLTEAQVREDESYDDPVSLTTGTIETIIQPEWNSNGRVFIRQVDPIPLSILAVAPAGLFPIRGG